MKCYLLCQQQMFGIQAVSLGLHHYFHRTECLHQDHSQGPAEEQRDFSTYLVAQAKPLANEKQTEEDWGCSSCMMTTVTQLKK